MLCFLLLWLATPESSVSLVLTTAPKGRNWNYLSPVTECFWHRDCHNLASGLRRRPAGFSPCTAEEGDSFDQKLLAWVSRVLHRIPLVTVLCVQTANLWDHGAVFSQPAFCGNGVQGGELLCSGILPKDRMRVQLRHASRPWNGEALNGHS